ncbi:MAG TPA: hypothetical protein VHQ91_01460 [Geminicoccaceae bacterium]|nr:hypothetical protein [Geminicoccaceae bacterium]
MDHQHFLRPPYPDLDGSLALTDGASGGMEHAASQPAGAIRNLGSILMLRTKSKNDTSTRGAADDGKTFEGKKVKPVLYVGTAVGHGRYIAAQDEGGKLIMGRDGKPVAFRDV